MKSLIFSASLLVFICLAGSLGAAGQSKPDLAKPPSDSTPVPSTPKLPEGVGAAIDPNKYVIGPEDIIFIQVWREQDFTRQLSVRPDGKITLPLVGDIQAAGLTPLALTQDVKQKLSKYLNSPDVTITVTDVRSKKYYIDGEVRRPGPYPLITPTRVLEALSMAGGFQEFANQKDVRILRGNQTLRFNYKEVIKGKRPEQNILLENGDHIIVR